MRMSLPLACLLALVCAGSFAATPAMVASTDNKELADLYAQDQADRATGNIDWAVVAPRDEARQARVRDLLRSGDIRTAADYHHAAMLFQHGNKGDDIRLAHALATLAMTLDGANKGFRWLTAASWDRLLMYHLQPQWYGTQFGGDSRGMYLYPVAENAVTDAEREALGVPALAESRQHVTDAAKMSGLSVRATPPTIEELQNEAAAAKATGK